MKLWRKDYPSYTFQVSKYIYICAINLGFTVKLTFTTNV